MKYKQQKICNNERKTWTETYSNDSFLTVPRSTLPPCIPALHKEASLSICQSKNKSSDFFLKHNKGEENRRDRRKQVEHLNEMDL